MSDNKNRAFEINVFSDLTVGEIKIIDLPEHDNLFELVQGIVKRNEFEKWDDEFVDYLLETLRSSITDITEHMFKEVIVKQWNALTSKDNKNIQHTFADFSDFRNKVKELDKNLYTNKTHDEKISIDTVNELLEVNIISDSVTHTKKFRIKSLETKEGWLKFVNFIFYNPISYIEERSQKLYWDLYDDSNIKLDSLQEWRDQTENLLQNLEEVKDGLNSSLRASSKYLTDLQNCDYVDVEPINKVITQRHLENDLLQKVANTIFEVKLRKEYLSDDVSPETLDEQARVVKTPIVEQQKLPFPAGLFHDKDDEWIQSVLLEELSKKLGVAENKITIKKYTIVTDSDGYSDGYPADTIVTIDYVDSNINKKKTIKR